MKDYQIKTIKRIKAESFRLACLSDEELIKLYQTWSKSTYCVNWVYSSRNIIEKFCIWATTAPCDRVKDNE